MQKCAYCAADFVPKVRFTQKYCCKSCKVLYCRHKGTRAEYEARKATTQVGKAGEDLTAPKPQVQRFLRVFLRDYASKRFSAQALKEDSIQAKLASLLAQVLASQERAWLTEIHDTIQEMCTYKPTTKPNQLLLTEATTEAINAYIERAN